MPSIEDFTSGESELHVHPEPGLQFLELADVSLVVMVNDPRFRLISASVGG